jgi:hypothetical protein
MKLPVTIKFVMRIIPALVVLLTGWNAYSEKGGVVQIIKNATTPFDNSRVESVPPVPKKAVLAKVKYQGGLFRIETRKDIIKRFKCSQCHNNQTVTTANALEIAHGDMDLIHGGKDKPLACFTCHNKEERDYLVTEKGSRIDMDHSYQMCGQCHFRQKIDWVGGAHGKRISNWKGTRVVKNCTGCHDPHAPLFDKRWPITYSIPLSK